MSAPSPKQWLEVANNVANEMLRNPSVDHKFKCSAAAQTICLNLFGDAATPSKQVCLAALTKAFDAPNTITHVRVDHTNQPSEGHSFVVVNDSGNQFLLEADLTPKLSLRACIDNDNFKKGLPDNIFSQHNGVEYPTAINFKCKQWDLKSISAGVQEQV